MAEIEVFKGYRYNPHKIKDLNQVVSPPYDKIDEEKRMKLLEKDPCNIIRLILGEENREEGRYQKAAAFLDKWIKEKILIEDGLAGFYVYFQEYEINGQKKTRKGFVGLGKIEDKSGVKEHEDTMEAPKEDRLNLIRATEANFGHIFMLYSDRQNKINNILEENISNRHPLIEVNDENGNLHMLWKLENKELISIIKKEMTDKKLYIADGHHRYQTALNYKEECEKKGFSGDFNYRLMTFINSSDPGLSILPTHRLIYGLEEFEIKDFINKIKDEFTVEKYNNSDVMKDRLEAKNDSNAFGLYAGGENYWILTLKDKNIMGKLVNNYSQEWCELDVAVLHRIILDRHLGIDRKALKEKRNLEYIRNSKEAISKVKQGKFQACFFLNPTPVEKVIKLADQGEKMPQKSTDFYPKLLTGLVLHKLSIDKN